uniref:PGG domain-containing protein n=1 Tax=Oryza rufipogon TaxID=4529 RepID=A0A0E0RDL6_ORYRU
MVDGDAGRRAPAPATSPAAEEAEFLWELRKYVLLLATLAATVTYTAGLDPPGGFWTDNVGELLAGDPYLLIFATLAATVAYQAGLSTPGGFWLGSLENQHLAGDPMLRGNHPY